MPTTRRSVSHTAARGCKSTAATRALRDGLFIVFEGLDGAGKTTQINLLATALRQEGYPVLCLKEPTDGPWGQKIRQSTRQGRRPVDPADELTWFLEDRRQDVEQNIRPALTQGWIVILDRYYFSTMAYQGALGYDPDEIRHRNEAFAPPPHLLFLLEIDPSQGLQRVQQTRQLDGFEQLDYLQQVKAIFAAMDFPYLRRIPASDDIETVQAHIWQEVRDTLTTWPHAVGAEPSTDLSEKDIMQ
jgi:dTMP kinase